MHVYTCVHVTYLHICSLPSIVHIHAYMVHIHAYMVHIHAYMVHIHAYMVHIHACMVHIHAYMFIDEEAMGKNKRYACIHTHTHIHA
jgi:hypothetical protein